MRSGSPAFSAPARRPSRALSSTRAQPPSARRPVEVPSPTFTLVQPYEIGGADHQPFRPFPARRARRTRWSSALRIPSPPGSRWSNGPTGWGRCCRRAPSSSPFSRAPGRMPGRPRSPAGRRGASGSEGRLTGSARSREIDRFLARAGWPGAAVAPLAADASFRRYLRVRRGVETAVLDGRPARPRAHRAVCGYRPPFARPRIQRAPDRRGGRPGWAAADGGSGRQHLHPAARQAARTRRRSTSSPSIPWSRCTGSLPPPRCRPASPPIRTTSSLPRRNTCSTGTCRPSA